jgi:glycosyltransferase involved in cell wall biosynthesis
MKICVVSGTFHPEPGGPPTFLYRLLPELIARGHSVEVVTYGEVDAPRHYPYPITRISRRQSILLRLMNFARAVWFAGRRADVFFVSDYGLPVGVVNLFLHHPILLKNVGDFAWEFSVRHKWIPAGETIDQFQTAPHSLRVNLLRAVQRWYTGAARLVIAPSRYSASLVTGWGIDPDRVCVIYNALDPFDDLPTPDAARRALGLSGKVVVTVARLAPWKGVSALIRAIDRLRRDIPEIRLVVVGDGPERAALETQTSSFGGAVLFAGAQNPERVYWYLRAADVFSLFSTYEGLPHTVLEAMQAGTPVVVSDAGGNVEVVADGETGWVVPRGDETALAAALKSALCDSNLARLRAESAKASLSKFSWPRLVDEYEAALKSLI